MGQNYNKKHGIQQRPLNILWTEYKELPRDNQMTDQLGYLGHLDAQNNCRTLIRLNHNGFAMCCYHISESSLFPSSLPARTFDIGKGITGLARYHDQIRIKNKTLITMTSHERRGILNRWPPDCLFNSLFMLHQRKYKSSALLVICEENQPMADGFHSKSPVKLCVYVIRSSCVHISMGYSMGYIVHLGCWRKFQRADATAVRMSSCELQMLISCTLSSFALESTTEYDSICPI